MTKIALFGAKGRLGSAVASFSVGLPIPFEILPLTRTSPLFEGGADICLDVTLANAFPIPLNAALKYNKPIVIGVTGLLKEQHEQIKQAATQIPIFYSANFSIGMALFQFLAKEIGCRFDEKATIDLFETHHSKKKDSPSGSALALAALLEKTGKSPFISSARKDQVIGEHSLLFSSEEESLQISHTVHTRRAFAKGALRAVQFLLEKPPGLYGMSNFLIDSLKTSCNPS